MKDIVIKTILLIYTAISVMISMWISGVFFGMYIERKEKEKENGSKN